MTGTKIDVGDQWGCRGASLEGDLSPLHLLPQRLLPIILLILLVPRLDIRAIVIGTPFLGIRDSFLACNTTCASVLAASLRSIRAVLNSYKL